MPSHGVHMEVDAKPAAVNGTVVALHRAPEMPLPGIAQVSAMIATPGLKCILGATTSWCQECYNILDLEHNGNHYIRSWNVHRTKAKAKRMMGA